MKSCWPCHIPSSTKRWRRRLDAILVIGPAALARAIETAAFIDSSKPITPELADHIAAAARLVEEAALRRNIPDRPVRRPSPRLAGGPQGAARQSACTIICLGNGPSSEDPSLADFGDATLFRVNWNWRGRGWLTTPDVVFTADPDLPGFGRRPIIVFPTASVGRPILLRHTRAMRPPSAGYVFLDAFDPPLTDLSGPMIPTNGALMIAVAVALEPERIVISGMDLYQHPRGTLPRRYGCTGRLFTRAQRRD